MSKQTTFPRETPLESPNICAWCGEQAVAELQLEPARYALSNPPRYGIDGKRTRVLRKRAIVAKVCDFHYKTLKVKDGN